jgi:hypothetical protein
MQKSKMGLAIDLAQLQAISRHGTPSFQLCSLTTEYK